MIKETVVGGITTLIAPSAGPTQAGIAFRVGRADEPLARAGVTHLVEHLALHHVGTADYHFNGATGNSMTRFHSAGSPEDVSTFLAGVCDALTSLPLDRMEMEKEILRTEASSRTRPVTEPMPLWRYGSRGYGVPSYPEWGLSMLGPDDIRSWVGRYFTAENAVAWIAGTMPQDLTFRLPAGRRQPLPEVTSALASTPAYFVDATRVVALESVVRRGPAAQVFARVLERELFRALRQEGGLSYTTATDYEPRDATHAVVAAVADALPEKQGAVLGGFIDVLAKLRVGRVEPSDVAAVLEQARESFQHPELHAGRLPVYAFNLLIGYPNETVEELQAALAAVTPADVQALAEEALASALLMVPDGHRADWAGFSAAPTSSATAISGQRFPMRKQRGSQLVVGAEGVSTVSPRGAATVRFDECTAMLMWPDGGRLLVGADSIICRVEPTVYKVSSAALDRIDAAVPAQRRVRQPARDPDEIPRPAQPVSVIRTPLSALQRIVIAALALLAALAAGCSGLMTLGVSVSDEPIENGWATVAFLWAVTVLLVGVTVWVYRVKRRQRR